TQKEIAGIQSATSRQNTKDQVYAQNEMLAYQQKESTARVASIMENTNLSKQQQVSEIMRQMLTQAQTAGQYFTNEFLVSMQISISSLQTHNVNRCGRSRHLARKLSLRRKRSSPNVFEMAATETITSIILIKLI